MDGIIRVTIQSHLAKSTDFRLPTVRNQQVTRSSRVAGSKFLVTATRADVNGPRPHVARGCSRFCCYGDRDDLRRYRTPCRKANALPNSSAVEGSGTVRTAMSLAI